MTATTGWVGLVSATAAAVAGWAVNPVGVIALPGQGAAFVAAGAAFVVDVLVSVLVSSAVRSPG